MYMCISTYVYVYIYTHTYIYIVYIYVCVYIYIECIKGDITEYLMGYNGMNNEIYWNIMEYKLW